MLTDQQVRTKINQLLDYAQKALDLDSRDRILKLNTLLDLFGQTAPSDETPAYADFQTEIADPLVQYAVDKGITDDASRILFETRMFGLLTPLPSAVTDKFYALKDAKSVKAATDWLFALSKANDYVRMTDINKNIKWEYTGKFGKIGITINLSKPEKDPKLIALAKLQPKSGYPACMLCESNVGFAGNLNHPARQTLRTIPITLDGEDWWLQYSPYQYYEEHAIAFSDEHRPMSVTPKSFARLLDFVDLFPHYFMGSNAALPIVGGSILTHDHYQGGLKVLPMMSVGSRAEFKSDKFFSVKFAVADWYNSVVRLTSKDKAQIHAAASYVLEKWNDWTDESVEVICKTTEQHNAITPIVRKEGDEYIIDMILRNNRTDERRPYGIFHPEERLHNIKKEGIGIIEVMGLFILPGRLKKELAEVEKYLTGEIKFDKTALSAEEHPMHKHAGMIEALIAANGSSLSEKTAKKAVTDYVNDACVQILEYTAVFKNDLKGQAAFAKFMKDGLGVELVTHKYGFV